MSDTSIRPKQVYIWLICSLFINPCVHVFFYWTPGGLRTSVLKPGTLSVAISALSAAFHLLKSKYELRKSINSFKLYINKSGFYCFIFHLMFTEHQSSDCCAVVGCSVL